MPRRKQSKQINVKGKFRNAIQSLKHMRPAKQRAAALGSSNEFIRDISSFFSKIRKRPDLLSSKRLRNVLKQHRSKLRKLVHAKTPLSVKRRILSSTGRSLSQTGGILPFLIPIIVAGIGAAGSVGAAATHAAISRA